MNTATDNIKAHNARLAVREAGGKTIKTTDEARHCTKCGARLNRYNTEPRGIFVGDGIKTVCDPCYNSWAAKEARGEDPRPKEEKMGRTRELSNNARRLQMLDVVARLEPVSTGEVASLCEITQSLAYSRVRVLVKRGWIAAMPARGTGCPGARVLYQLTPKGEKIMKGGGE